MTSPSAPTGRTAGRSASLIIGATVIAGIAGYAVTFIVFRQIGPVAYVVFAAFWAAMYLVIGALSGIQQEITRATHPIEFGARAHASHARNFAFVVTASLFVLMVATSPLWAHLEFPRAGGELIWPLAVGASSYVLVATLGGTLYGVAQWRSIFWMIVTDSVLRLLFLIVALFITRDVVWLAWAAALPIPLTILLLWRSIRPGVVGRSDIDVGYRVLTWNVARTVLASVSTAVLVSGFPVILTVAGRSTSQAFVGHLIFAITITRAPLIVVVMSLQSFLIVRFRSHDRSLRRSLALVVTALLGGGIVLAGLAWLIGPPILNWLSGGPTGINGELMGILVISSALIAALTVTGSAVLARGRHFIYSLGWVAAAIATIVVMSIPLPLVERVEAALLIGPVVGLLFHGAWLAWGTHVAHAQAPVPGNRE
jgi:O-antigen/teichoic acid export membrane protein